jgi:hypothetical protein
MVVTAVTEMETVEVVVAALAGTWDLAVMVVIMALTTVETALAAEAAAAVALRTQMAAKAVA